MGIQLETEGGADAGDPWVPPVRQETWELPMHPMTPREFNALLDTHLERVVAGDPLVPPGGILTRSEDKRGTIIIPGGTSDVVVTKRYKIDVPSVADVGSFVNQVFSMRTDVAIGNGTTTTTEEIDARQQEDDRQRRDFLVNHSDAARLALSRFLTA